MPPVQYLLDKVLITLVIDSAHGRDLDSRNRPVRRIAYFPLLAAKLDFRLKQEVVNCCLLAEGKTVTSLYRKRDDLIIESRLILTGKL